MALRGYGAPLSEDQTEEKVLYDDWSGRRKHTLTKFVLGFPFRSQL